MSSLKQLEGNYNLLKRLQLLKPHYENQKSTPV